MAFERKLANLTVKVLKGNLLEVEAEALVNPANSLLIMGGGVAGAIERFGGAEIEREARKHAPCPVGKAVATGAGKLKAKHVIHAPTMERPAMATSPSKVYQATKAALECAKALNISSIAFPGMGTGVGGVPFAEAAEAMVKAVKEHAEQGTSLKEVFLVGLEDGLVEAFKKALKKLG
ncbi:MAG: macro domain-containing protein [Candidatus Hecatellales archaeon]|nr:MAG: macro domain-containing protein [Candidatus Hecatellales archaeon]